MIPGTLYVVSAPSGAGKSSLIQALLKTQQLYNTKVSISYTTRAMRPGESNGKHYHFITKSKFQQMIRSNDFLEYACVFGNYYGTSRVMVQDIIHSGVDVFLDVNWQGAQQIRKTMCLACTIFILPPSKNELLRRLRKRKQDNDETINHRMVKAVADMEHYREYDYIIINDNFNTALGDLQSITQSERLRLDRQVKRHHALINKLLED
ncbi:MAG: guanylate kinase [Candidatus Arsenophonus melophagi]|nr:guanylate kinase [Candidatus Arsenophonus melophagi]